MDGGTSLDGRKLAHGVLDDTHFATALKLMDDGEYHRCLECGEIAAGPLDADPTFARCVICAGERGGREMAKPACAGFAWFDGSDCLIRLAWAR